MPILSRVGRRRPKQVLIRGVFYTALCVGAVVTIYPMMLVFGQAMSDRFDLRDNAVLPRYWFDENELALKHVFSYTSRLTWLAARHNRPNWTTQPRMREDEHFLEDLQATVRAQGFDPDAPGPALQDYGDFKKTLEAGVIAIKAFRAEDFYRPFLERRYKQKADALLAAVGEGEPVPVWLHQILPDPGERKRVLGSRRRLGLAILNHEFQSDYSNFFAVETMPEGNVLVPVWRPPDTAKYRMWGDFIAELPAEQLFVITSDVFWHDFLRRRYDRVDALNTAWGTDYQGFAEVRLPITRPADETLVSDWDRFVTQRWPRRLLRLPAGYDTAWQDFLKARMGQRLDGTPDDSATLAELREMCGIDATDWSQVALPRQWPRERTTARLWAEFTSRGTVPAREMILDAPELRWRDFLADRHGGEISALNRSWGTAFDGFADVPLPVALADHSVVARERSRLRKQHAVDSFRRITAYVFGRGRAVQNTIILIVLSLLSALTINPLAAYSLSRFTMRQSHKILIFFLATMAFPAEVTMIPNFLLLRDLQLLNTYAALVLPTMANGFSIFLLKCFFDSLPRELYEAAEMDGASEQQCFRLVALPLVLPIMAYIGLNTFVLAYGSFMWAFVICPEPSMWTLMVWVYDFQYRNPGDNFVMASVLLVSIPPLIVFLFANRIIMRGIMIPQMK